MWRYFLAAGAALMLAAACMFVLRSPASSQPKLPEAPSSVAGATAEADPLPDEAPSASAKTREEKRFDRFDKDRNDGIAREEYLLARRKAFAKLDADGDGRLAFDEWATKAITKFTDADKDKSGTLTRVEFATTAPKPKAAKAKCACTAPETKAAED